MTVTEQKGKRTDVPLRKGRITLICLTFEKREDTKISGICGTEVASRKTNMIWKCLYLDVQYWVKKYAHLRTESKTGHNVRLLSSTTSFVISYKLQKRDCAFPKIP